MKSEQRSLEKIRETFAQRFSFITRIDPEEPAVILPEENVRERKKGSIRYFGNCVIRYVFGEEDDDLRRKALYD